MKLRVMQRFVSSDNHSSVPVNRSRIFLIRRNVTAKTAALYLSSKIRHTVPKSSINNELYDI